MTSRMLNSAVALVCLLATVSLILQIITNYMWYLYERKNSHYYIGVLLLLYTLPRRD